MASPQLTVKQFATIALGQTAPPWHLGNLLQVYGQKFLELRSTIANLSASQAVMFVAMRSAQAVAASASAIFNVSGSGAQQELWDNLWTAQNAVTRSDLAALEQVLTPVGASIVYLSPQLPPTGNLAGTAGYIPAWATIGFAGTFFGLASLSAQMLPYAPAEWTSTDWDTLKGLTGVVVIVPAGGGYTSAPLYGGSLMPGFTLGPKITTMMILGGGTGGG